jgi:uncharacterized protein YxjI
MLYCENCGAKVTKEQRFCEKCGSELKRESPSKQISEPQIRTAPKKEEGLFDLNRNYYIIKEKMWDLGYGDILDEKGQLIGRMNRQIFSVRRRVELQEIDGTVGATIHSKIVSARGAQDLKTPDGQPIARIKRKILTFFRHVFFLEDPETRTRWYEAEGNFMGWSFKIYEIATKKLVAEIEKADRWRDVFLGGLFDYSDTYALKILDNETDRRILLGFVLSIDNILFDTAGIGPRFGPGQMRRRIPYRPGRFPQ